MNFGEGGRRVAGGVTATARRTLCLLAALCLLSGAAWAADREGRVLKKRVLVIGRVDVHPEAHRGYLQRMVDYAAGRMGDLGIVAGEVVVAPDNAAMLDHLRSGKVDWVTETPFSALRFEGSGNAEIVARRWKGGVAAYRTLLFVRADSDIRSPGDLRGRTIAFEDPGSTSAYFLPAAVLIRRGHRLVRLSSIRQAPRTDGIGYVFSGDERNTADWVHAGVVDAGALSDTDWADPELVPPAYREALRVIHRTGPVPRALELVRADLDPAVKARLVELLLHAHEDPEAAGVLDAYQKTRRFDPIDAETRAQLEALRPLADIVRRELGP